MNAESIGRSSVLLGADRETKDSVIDFVAGIILHKKIGDAVKVGDSLATLYTSKEILLNEAAKCYSNAIEIGDTKPEARPLIYSVSS